MKKILLLLSCYILLAFIFVHKTEAQKDTTLTFFALPLLEGENYSPGNIYVSVHYSPLFSKPIESIKDDWRIDKLKTILSALKSSKKELYILNSNKYDTTIEESYKFYNVFVPHANEFSLFCSIEIGDYHIYFVHLQDGFPLMTFCLKDAGSNSMNSPSILNNPLITALADAINKTYKYPKEFNILKKIPHKNTKITIDSIFGNNQKDISFYFDIYNVSFNCNEVNDSTNTYPQTMIPYLNFYKKSLELIRHENLDEYLSLFSEESKTRISASIKKANLKEIRFYKDYKASFNKIIKVIDLGNQKLLYVTKNINPKGRPRVFQKIYLKEDYKNNNKISIINENNEFYLDDLLKVPLFYNQIFKN